jgi:hypothetical protein
MPRHRHTATKATAKKALLGIFIYPLFFSLPSIALPKAELTVWTNGGKEEPDPIKSTILATGIFSHAEKPIEGDFVVTKDIKEKTFSITDKLGHASFATFNISAIVTSLNSLPPPSFVGTLPTANGELADEWWKWLITGSVSVGPQCQENEDSCEKISAILNFYKRGYLSLADDPKAPGISKWDYGLHFKTIEDRGVERPGTLPELPGPLPVLGVFASLGFSRRLRMRIKSSKSEVINPT